MDIKVYHSADEESNKEYMPGISAWFSANGLNPIKGEHIFVWDTPSEEFKKVLDHCNTLEWVIVDKFYSPQNDKIVIWCEDVTN